MTARHEAISGHSVHDDQLSHSQHRVIDRRDAAVEEAGRTYMELRLKMVSARAAMLCTLSA